MENSENKNQETTEIQSEPVCEYCGRSLREKQTIGFGQTSKTEPCTCSPLNKTCSGRTGWGN